MSMDGVRCKSHSSDRRANARRGPADDESRTRIQRAQPANGSGHVTVRLVVYAVTSSEVVLVDTISRNLRHQSSPMRVGGEVIMISHGYTLRTRLEHASRTLGTLQIRSALAACSLDMRLKHARCALGAR